MLPEILTRVGRMPAAHPVDGEPLQYGRIYIAPPDHHLIVEDGAAARRPQRFREWRSSGRRSALSLRRPRLRAARHRRRAHRGARRRDGGYRGDQGRRAGSRSRRIPTKLFRRGCRAARCIPGSVDHVLPLRDIPLLLAALVEEEAVAPRRAPRQTEHLRRDGTGSRRDAARPFIRRSSGHAVGVHLSRMPRHTVGSSTRAVCCASAAASDTSTRPTACSRRRPTKWIARCGRRCARWRSAPRSRTSWRSAGASGGHARSTRRSRCARAKPSRKPAQIRALLRVRGGIDSLRARGRRARPWTGPGDPDRGRDQND